MVFKEGDKVQVVQSGLGPQLTEGATGVIAERKDFGCPDETDSSSYYYGVYVDGQTQNWYHKYNELKLIERG